MKIQGVMQDLEISASNRWGTEVAFEIVTPIGVFTYNSDRYLYNKNAISAFEQFGINSKDLMSLKYNDVSRIIFDIDISARVRKGEE